MVPPGSFVNVGSGPNASDGWISMDGSWQAWMASHPIVARVARLVTGRQVGHWNRGIVCRDVRNGLGLPPESAAVIFSSHLIEHLHRSEALALLRDCRRVLKPGGICRIVTPDLAVMVSAYTSAGVNGADRAGDELQAALLLHPTAPQHAGRLLGAYRRRKDFDHHKWVYDGPSLCALFRDAGFAGASVRAHLDSGIPRERLAQVEEPSRVLDGAGMCVEASK